MFGDCMLTLSIHFANNCSSQVFHMPEKRKNRGIWSPFHSKLLLIYTKLNIMTPDELYTKLTNVVKEPVLIFAAVERLVEIYSVRELPFKQSTAQINSALALIGVTGKGNRRARGELCICFILMKLWNQRDALPSSRELCEQYGLPLHIVQKDVYFQRFCYYLPIAVEVVLPHKHREFIIQDILTPLSGAAGIKYITGGGMEAPRTAIRIRAFELVSKVFRPRSMNALSPNTVGSTHTTGSKRSHSTVLQDTNNKHNIDADEQTNDGVKHCRTNPTEYSDSSIQWIDELLENHIDTAEAPSTVAYSSFDDAPSISQPVYNPDHPFSPSPKVEHHFDP